MEYTYEKPIEMSMNPLENVPFIDLTTTVIDPHVKFHLMTKMMKRFRITP